jgi:hypothetical protein
MEDTGLQRFSARATSVKKDIHITWDSVLTDLRH